MPAAVDVWSSPTTLYAGGLRQLPTALGGRPMVLIADQRLDSQIEAVQQLAPAVLTVRIAGPGAAGDAAQDVRAAIDSNPTAVPVALGGGSVMDIVRLAALAAADPGAERVTATVDGVAFLPTRTVNPTVCIPSTIGTAAEVSPVVVRAVPAGTSMIISPGLRSAAAIVDPQLTGSLPVAALAAGLVEPLARVAVPAVGAAPLRFQDGVARGLAATILALGDELPDHPPDHLPDESWRVAAALASAQTHLSLIALGRPPAGHNLWPLATEVMRATGLSKSAALAALIPAWLRCLSSGILGRSWGTPDRVRQILGTEPAAARIRLDAWLRGLSLPTSLPAGVDVESVASRVLDPWQAAGLFLPGVGRGEIVAVLDAARSDESVPVSGSGPG